MDIGTWSKLWWMLLVLTNMDSYRWVKIDIIWHLTWNSSRENKIKNLMTKSYMTSKTPMTLHYLKNRCLQILSLTWNTRHNQKKQYWPFKASFMLNAISSRLTRCKISSVSIDLVAYKSPPNGLPFGTHTSLMSFISSFLDQITCWKRERAKSCRLI